MDEAVMNERARERSGVKLEIRVWREIATLDERPSDETGDEESVILLGCVLSAMSRCTFRGAYAMYAPLDRVNAGHWTQNILVFSQHILFL